LLVEGRAVAPSADETLHQFAALWFRTRVGLAEATIRNRDEDYRLRIAGALGTLPLRDVTREQVEDWLAGLVAAASSRRMITETVKTLRAMLSTAVEWGRIQSNPAAGLALPAPLPDDQAVERVLDEEGLVRLLTHGAVGARVETMLRAAAEGCLRRGEVIGLRWPDVDLVSRRMHVRRAVWQRNGPDGPVQVVQQTKGRRNRQVAIGRTFAKRLSDWYAESVVKGGAQADGYVWPGRRDQPMHNRSPGRALERACARAGLVDDDERPVISFHGLRHTGASLLLAHNVPLIVVSRHLGHASTQVTSAVYAHLLRDDQLDIAADVFDVHGAQTLREILREDPHDA
jgi:integrase